MPTINEKGFKSKIPPNSCFVIMPYSSTDEYKDDPEHFKYIYEQIFIPAIEQAGYEPYKLDDNNISTYIINDIFEAVQNCPIALCDLSSKNPNVLYELGLRQAYDKPVVLVKDEKTGRIFDVSGINTISYDSHRLVENVQSAIKKIATALIDTKNGNYNTVASIVKATSAEYIDFNESNKDNLSVLLNILLSEIKGLKNGQTRDNNLKQADKKTISRVYTRELKLNSSSVSDSKTKAIIKEAKEYFSSEINYKKLGVGSRSIIISGISETEVNGCYSWLKKMMRVF